jgi:hypothetical protein
MRSVCLGITTKQGDTLCRICGHSTRNAPDQAASEKILFEHLRDVHRRFLITVERAEQYHSGVGPCCDSQFMGNRLTAEESTWPQNEGCPPVLAESPRTLWRRRIGRL